MRRIRRLNRREAVKNVGMGIFGFGLASCSSRKFSNLKSSVNKLALPIPSVSWDRILGTTVGFRPYRSKGFVLGSEMYDRKFVVHNYGHGGAGMSLSWGTGQMATELALERPERRAAVLGCGVVGLTSARQLQRSGFTVTIYAASIPPNTTSNMSLAAFTPTSGLLDFRSRTPQWEEQFRRAVRLAYEYLQLLVGSRYGVSKIQHYTPTDDIRLGSGQNMLLPKELQPEMRVLKRGEHSFPKPFVVEQTQIKIEPSIYLDALLLDFHRFGGKLIMREFGSINEVVTLPETVILNCTGLGSKKLFEDEELVPHKGQLTVMIPDKDIQYATNGGLKTSSGRPGSGLHMYPRSDGIVLGGTSEKGVWNTDVNKEEQNRIVNGHIDLFDAMRMLSNVQLT